MSDDANARRFNRLLEMGDMKLIFHDGRSIKVHCTKIKLASLGGWFQCVVEDFLEDQVVATRKWRRTA